MSRLDYDAWKTQAPDDAADEAERRVRPEWEVESWEEWDCWCDYWEARDGDD